MSLSAESIVENNIIDKILEGKLKPFEKLKPERELAEEMGYSRPVIHKAIIRLEDKGLVRIKPRKWVEVTDYRVHGKLSLLEPILAKSKKEISFELNTDMLSFIKDNFKSIVSCFRLKAKEDSIIILNSQQGYFNWLHDYAIRSGNIIYPMLMNEFEVGIKNAAKALIDNKDIEQSIVTIETAVVKGDIDLALELIDPLFDKILECWIGGSYV
jgi:DNA-binding transcriptional regulator YhcF (GntR family)